VDEADGEAAVSDGEVQQGESGSGQGSGRWEEGLCEGPADGQASVPDGAGGEGEGRDSVCGQEEAGVQETPRQDHSGDAEGEGDVPVQGEGVPFR